AEAFVLIQRWCARRDIALATGLVEPDPSDPVHAPSLPPLAAAYWLGAKALATPQWRDGKTPIGDAAPLVLHRSAYSLKGARSQTGAHALHTPWWSYTAPLHQALGRISMLIAEDASRALIFNPPTGVDASLPPDAADERSMNSMSQRGSSNYLLEDSTNGNIRVRHRDAGRYQFLVLVNGSEA